MKGILKKPKELTKTASVKSNDLENQGDDEGSRSNIISLPSSATDDLFGFSDIPINKVSFENEGKILKVPDQSGLKDSWEVKGKDHSVPNTSKPQGSAYISVKMSIGVSKELVNVDLCVDTGADFTVCDTAFLKKYYGPDALKHIRRPWRLPILRSATGHTLKMLGVIDTVIHLGTYVLSISALVHDEDISVFLLGSDAFYNRLIFDRGMYLAFPENKYPPVPIKYELVKKLVKAVCQYQIPPRSSAVIQVNVTDNARITGKEVLLTPMSPFYKNNNHQYKDIAFIDDEAPVRNTVSVIDSQGNSFVLMENDTDDILTILPDYEIAQAELIQKEEGTVNLINYEIDQDKTTSLSKNGQWPISALKNELADKIPSNVLVQWEKLKPHNSKCCDEDPSDVHHINYVHDKEERKHLLDGTGEGFPIPPAADSVHPDQDLDTDPEAWLKNVEHQHLSDIDC